MRKITISKKELKKLKPIDPKKCELGTLYINISGYGRYKVYDLYNIKCATYFDHTFLQEYIDHLRVPNATFTPDIRVK